MSKLYGTLAGDGRAANRTRCANRETSASAQSWEGSITAGIRITSDGEHQAILRVADGSQHGGRILWEGKLAELVGARALTVTR